MVGKIWGLFWIHLGWVFSNISKKDNRKGVNSFAFRIYLRGYINKFMFTWESCNLSHIINNLIFFINISWYIFIFVDVYIYFLVLVLFFYKIYFFYHYKKDLLVSWWWWWWWWWSICQNNLLQKWIEKNYQINV